MNWRHTETIETEDDLSRLSFCFVMTDEMKVILSRYTVEVRQTRRHKYREKEVYENSVRRHGQTKPHVPGYIWELALKSARDSITTGEGEQ